MQFQTSMNIVFAAGILAFKLRLQMSQCVRINRNENYTKQIPTEVTECSSERRLQIESQNDFWLEVIFMGQYNAHEGV